MWHQWKRINGWIKSLFLFCCTHKYSHSFITSRLNHWCHMDYFNDVLTTFLNLECGCCITSYACQNALGFYQKYLNLCSEDEQRSYGFGTAWMWVINKIIFIFGWTIPLITNGVSLGAGLSVCPTNSRLKMCSIQTLKRVVLKVPGLWWKTL